MKHILLGDFKNYKPKQARQYIRPVEDFIDEALIIAENGLADSGDKLCWEKTHNKIGFIEGQVTVWTGLSSNGKSMVMGQVAAWLAKETSVLIASMEMPAWESTLRMMTQANGSTPDKTFADKFINRTHDNLWIYDKTDDVESSDILLMIDWAAEMQGIKHIMIDSIMCCGIDDNDLNAQKEFMNQLTTRAKKYKIHIHLVAHSRKEPVGVKNFVPDTLGDIAGSSKIGNLAHNVFCIHLNKNKDKNPRDADGYLMVIKNRTLQWTGSFAFWYHKESYQWLEDYPMYDLPMNW